VVQVSGHFDYAKQMDAVLEVLEIRTRKHTEPDDVDLLKQWSVVENSDLTDDAASSVLATQNSSVTDSAVGGEVEEAVEAADYLFVTLDDIPS